MQGNDNLKAVLDETRKAMQADVSILSVAPNEFLLGEDNKHLPETRFYTLLGSARIEGFFHQGTAREMYVMFDGSRSRSGGRGLAPLPSFPRWSWYKETDASLISIEDPMFYTFPQCTLGWYYGTKDEDYRQYCAQCIRKIADLLQIENENIILYGSSGGGTAAIGVSRYLPGCSVVAINPQIFLDKYPYSEELEKIAGMKLRTESDQFIRNDNCRIIRENSESVYFLIENVRSDGDYLTQFRVFCRQADIDPEFGIERNGNIVTWLYDAQGAPSTYSSVDNTAIFKMIELLIRHVRVGRDISGIKNLYDIVNEFWYERYSLMRTRYYQNKKMDELKAENGRISRENNQIRTEAERMRKNLDWGWIKAGVSLKRMLGKVKRKMER